MRRLKAKGKHQKCKYKRCTYKRTLPVENPRYCAKHAGSEPTEMIFRGVPIIRDEKQSFIDQLKTFIFKK